MPISNPYRVKTITEFHRLRGLDKPHHPLISVVDYAAIVHNPEFNVTSWVLDFYSISLKRNPSAKIRYGQQQYDFDEGVLFFIAPGQVFSVAVSAERPVRHTGWMLLIHPDFLWGTALARSIHKYEYFGYAVHEALFLSDKEERTMMRIIGDIREEHLAGIDKFSQDIIISQVETLLNYAERFYHRQFITRKKSSHQVVGQVDQLLTDYFNSEALLRNGLPTVKYISEQLNISPNYLRSLLKVLTGQNTQQHIHDKLIEKAKERLSTTSLSVSEIAYELGFEHPQSFSKLFRAKAHCSPLAFRQSFS